MFNEEKNLPHLLKSIEDVFASISNYMYEIVFVDDGSSDKSLEVVEELSTQNPNINFIEFSRNFGKEVATSAGLHFCTGDAAIAVDADLQHPIGLIPEFINKWEKGVDIVIGIRTANKGTTFFKKVASKTYYKIINFISTTPIIPGATDFRLIDRKVINEFNKLSERNRITRGLIDWLGFKKDYIYFIANERLHGEAKYSYLKLIKLAVSSSVAHSLIPLKFAGYLGMFITFTSFMGGSLVFIARYILNDAWGWHVSGTAQLAILMIFFIGIVLICLGLIALYIGNITEEVTNRPLYIVRNKKISYSYENTLVNVER